MTWVAWRQFRTQALVALGLLAALTAIVLVTGLHVRDVYSSLGGAHCGARNDCTALTYIDGPLRALLGPALLAIPALLGMFWGAPLVARELETGTYRLAWTQTVTRRRWLSVRIALVGVAALAVAGLTSWLVSWWFAPFDAVNMNRIDPGVFTARGVVAIGYAGFAFALGVAAGALLRRTLPAMAATLLGFLAARIAFTLWARPHLLAPRESLVPVTMGKGVPFFNDGSGWSVAAAPPPIPNAWTTSATFVDHGRHVVSGAELHALLSDVCPTVAVGGGKGAPPPGCEIALSRHLQQLVTYQPASHFWALQALETAIFLGSALALIAATVWLVGRRTGPKPAFSGSAGRATDPVALTLTPGN